MSLTKLNNASLSAVTSSGLPAGTVLQVITESFTASSGLVTSTTFVACPNGAVSASITPSSASNKILILASLPLYLQGAGSGSHGIGTIFRGGVASGTNIGSDFGLSQMYSGSGDNISTGAVNLMDSPATTSSVTYEVALRKNGPGTGVHLATNGDKFSLTLMEIAG